MVNGLSSRQLDLVLVEHAHHPIDECLAVRRACGTVDSRKRLVFVVALYVLAVHVQAFIG